jgi:hypothetical protein
MTPPVMDPDQALRRFADHCVFEYGLLNGDDRYRIEGAGPSFQGKAARIRITENGRFGNIFMQLFHATLVARAIGCSDIEAFRFDGGPTEERIQAGGFTFHFPVGDTRPPASVPTLVGHFFNSYAFGSTLRALSADAAWELVESAMRPIFDAVWMQPAMTEPDTLVVHFRAGDVFRDPNASSWYVQPPASYYTTAIAHSLETLEIREVLLVYEDRANPAIALVETWLRDRGLSFSVRSGSLSSDAACLATATHLVASVSTLTEATAILSRTLRTYIAFRGIESHKHIHQRVTPLVAGILRRKGVGMVVIADREGDYIAPRSWCASPEQLRRIGDYPATGLQVTASGSDQDVLEDPDILRARLGGAEAETARLRRKLAATQDALARLEKSRGRRLLRRLHAFRRALGLPWLRTAASD